MSNTKNNIIYAKELLLNKGYTLVLYDGKKLITSNERGMLPLLKLYESGRQFEGFSAADKVIGKAAAFMYVLLGIKEIYTNTISKSALEIFHNNNINAEYKNCSPNIINRTKTDICPMEKTVLDISSAQKAYEAIRIKLYNLRN